MIIQSNTELIALIPNVFAPGIGETDLYTKITPQLQATEQWFERYIIPFDTIENKPAYYDNVAAIIAYHAFGNAVDLLDLTLTDNGFAVASNDTIAPASKDRVDKLKASLKQQRDSHIAQLLTSFEQSAWWKGTKSFNDFHATIQHYHNGVFALPDFDKWLADRDKYVGLELQLAAKYISRPLYRIMKTDLAAVNADINLRYLYYTLGSLERDVINNHETLSAMHTRLIGLVNFIRTATEDDRTTPATAFECWFDTVTAQQYENHAFKNNKASGGYWL